MRSRSPKFPNLSASSNRIVFSPLRPRALILVGFLQSTEMEGLIGKMQKVGSRLAGFLDENKIKIAAVGTLAGSAYIATKLSPYAETAKFMIVTRQTINRVVTGGEGEEDTKEGDTPLTRQFEKILATGDRLVEIQ
eukprot:933136-Amorphochlora_amoeboformis.AAC.2